MVAQIAVDGAKNDNEIFYCSMTYLDELKAIFIRAAIAYLSDLSSKELSKDVLVNEGMLDAHASAQVDEVVVVTNSRLRIDAALDLLTSWCREQTGDGTIN